jgi:hypothetical protein
MVVRLFVVPCADARGSTIGMSNCRVSTASIRTSTN